MSGNNGLGDGTTPDDCAITVEAGEDVSAGDALALDQTANDGTPPTVVGLDSGSTDEDQEFGVAKEDISSGGTGAAQVSGGIIANVASGISQGEHLGASATGGQFASEDGTGIVAWSNEGGTDRTGTNLGTNEAEVYLG